MEALALGGDYFDVLFSGSRDGSVRMWDNKEVQPSLVGRARRVVVDAADWLCPWGP